MRKIETNQGFGVEKNMMRWFKGETHGWDCVDFQTSSSLYEVKSCRLLLNCNNNSHLINKKKKEKTITTQLGRFYVKVENHEMLKKISVKEGKTPKYIFAIIVGNQKVWKITSWDEVDKLLDKTKKHSPLRIHQIFKRELGLR